MDMRDIPDPQHLRPEDVGQAPQAPPSADPNRKLLRWAGQATLAHIAVVLAAVAMLAIILWFALR